MTDQVEQRAGRESGPLAHHLAVLAPPALASVLQGLVVGFAYGLFEETVALDPARLLGAAELGADLR